MQVSDYFDDLVQHEGCIPWLYCDVRGLITIGIGNLVPTPEAAQAMPLHHMATGEPATPDQKLAAWVKVKDGFTLNRAAIFYRQFSDLRMFDAEIAQLVASRLDAEFMPGLHRLFHGFDAFPLPARRALVDMAYNLGVHGLSHFVRLIAACQAQDWATAARECARSSSRGSRNTWTAQCFVDASVAG